MTPRLRLARRTFPTEVYCTKFDREVTPRDCSKCRLRTVCDLRD